MRGVTRHPGELGLLITRLLGHVTTYKSLVIHVDTSAPSTAPLVYLNEVNITYIQAVISDVANAT